MKTTLKQTTQSAPVLNTDAMQAAFEGIIAVIEQPESVASPEAKLQAVLAFARIGKEGGAIAELDGFDDVTSYLQSTQAAAKPRSMASINSSMKWLMADLAVTLPAEHGESTTMNDMVDSKIQELFRFMRLSDKG